MKIIKVDTNVLCAEAEKKLRKRFENEPDMTADELDSIAEVFMQGFKYGIDQTIRTIGSQVAGVTTYDPDAPCN